MNIWIIDHYAVPPQYYPLARQTIFARKLKERGYETTIFCASSVHNSDTNLANDAKLFREEIVDGVKYVFVTCNSYKGNGLKRILNMSEFAQKLSKVCKHYKNPDVVLSCSMTLQACLKGIQIAKKCGARAVAQVTDLWPETIVAFGKAGPYNPAVMYLRLIEKRIYMKSDAIVFSMEGAYDYIRERHWEKRVPANKVFFVNNGVDLEAFDRNKNLYLVNDDDLNNPDIIKIVYTGSIRKANDLNELVEIARNIKDKRIKFLIWGDGDDRESLETKVKTLNLSNIVFKGKVDKKYIAYITSKADWNLLHFKDFPILRFGLSMNKLFDYFAAGKPIICDFCCPYNPAIEKGAGIEIRGNSPSEKAENLEKQLANPSDTIAVNARKLAEEEYNFEVLTDKIESVLTGKVER